MVFPPNITWPRGRQYGGTTRMLPKMKPVSLEALSDIRCSCFLGMHPSKDFDKRILVIRFEGTFRVGSSGTEDADFIGAMGRAATFAFSPHGEITDFSALNYQWGDDMARVCDGFSGDAPMPSALVVGEHCRKALGTLFHGEHTTADACDAEGVFDTLDKAWLYVTKQLDANDSQ